MPTQEERERKHRAYANRLSKMGKQQQRIFKEQGEHNTSPPSPRQRRMFLEHEVLHVSCRFMRLVVSLLVLSTNLSLSCRCCLPTHLVIQMVVW